MYKLLIADDEPLIRKGIKQLMNLSTFHIKEIFEASNGDEALKIFNIYKPEIVLMDINMPKIDGLSAAKKIKTISPETKIAIITGYDYFDYAQTAIKIGVDDYILKPISKKDIAEVIIKLVNLLNKNKKDMEIKEIIEKIIMSKNENTSNNDYKNLIKEIIEKNYTDSQFSLSVLSKELNLSVGYLSIIFKKNFGIPFQDYLLQKRMEMAKLLLLTTELKNYEIAERIGIEDVNYFGLKFKKFYNCSPKQYKEKVLKNENP